MDCAPWRMTTGAEDFTMPALIGSEVGLYYDTDLEVREDEFLQTPTGRTYWVKSVRVQQRGQYAGVRRYLRAIVVPSSNVGPGDTVHEICWYKRS